jgi:glycine cleavage system H protein
LHDDKLDQDHLLYPLQLTVELQGDELMTYPESYRYTKEHEWIEVEGTTAKVGITDYAQNSLGDIVFVELPKVGSTIEKDKVFGSVESVKSVSDLFAPASGTVTAVNEELTTAPEKINTDAHTAWILTLELSDPSEVASLLSAEDYQRFIAEEGAH